MHRLIRPCLAVCAALLVACGSPITATQPAPAASTSPIESVPQRSLAPVPVAETSTPSPSPTTTPTPLASVVSEDKQGEWVEVSPAGLGFSVAMPRKPTVDQQYVELPFGRVPFSMHVVELDTMAYIVGLATYPKKVMQATDPATMLPGAQAGSIKNVDGRLVHEQEITLNGYPGREFTAEGTGKGSAATQLPIGGLLHARFYVVDNRMYQVMVIGTKDSLPQADIDKFFSSFQLIKQ